MLAKNLFWVTFQQQKIFDKGIFVRQGTKICKSLSFSIYDFWQGRIIQTTEVVPRISRIKYLQKFGFNIILS